MSTNETQQDKKENAMSWPMKVLIGIDQLGNALADGNPDFTISARVGEFAKRNSGKLRHYWKTLEFIINLTMLPVDGPDHYYKAFLG